MKLIAIDDGHGVDTPGKRSPKRDNGTFFKENDFNRPTAGYLEKELKRNGFRVLQVAPESQDIPLKERTNRANVANADLYVSIHANSAGSSWNGAHGIETFIYTNPNQSSKDIAKMVQRNLCKDTGLRDRGVKTADFHVLRETKMDAILVECGFMSNKSECQLLETTSYQVKCARAICKGICQYFGVQYKPYNPQSTTITIEVNGKDYKISGELINGYNFVSVRELGEIFGYTVSFKGSKAILKK